MTPDSWNRDWTAWRRLCHPRSLPAAFVDLDAFDANVDRARALAEARRRKVRVATKSVRCPALLRRALDRLGPVASGLMTYSPRESAVLASEDFADVPMLLAYPAASDPDLDTIARAVAGGADITVMIDCADHADALASAAARAHAIIPVCVDVDASLRGLGGRIHLGVRRSPIVDPADLVALCEIVARNPALRLAGIMHYEAQVAGTRDRDPDDAAMDLPRRAMRGLSMRSLRSFRAECVAALAARGFDLPLRNGGGSGSLALTLDDPSITEVTVGSGLMGTHLFDGADQAWEPALFLALRVVRRPTPGIVTVAGGGIVASGPPGPSRVPRVHLPAGLQTLPHEGWGEVQTPFVEPDDFRLAIGDPVIARPAKAGEPAERFLDYVLVRRGEVEQVTPTYRGRGWCFG